MEDIIVPPQFRSRHEFCPYPAWFRFLEGEAPGAGMDIAAEEAVGVIVENIGGVFGLFKRHL